MFITSSEARKFKDANYTKRNSYNILVYLTYLKFASRFFSSSEKETEEVAVFNSGYVCIGNKNLGVRKWDPFKMYCSNTILERAAQHQKKLKYQHTPKFALPFIQTIQD